MRSLLPLAVCCISLVSLQPSDPARLDLLHELAAQREDTASGSESRTGLAAPPPGVLSLRPASGVRVAPPSLAWARPVGMSSAEPRAPRARPTTSRPVGMSSAEPRAPRARRHAHSGPRGGHHGAQHGQLMRVGCVLGTCQVQNLSHRLYQLIGQSGREESSPVNPRSPHSYG